MLKEDSPYKVEASGKEVTLDGLPDDVIRGRYIREEVCILAVGWFYYCMASFQLGATAGLFLFPTFDDPRLVYGGAVLLSTTALLYITIGYGMRHFYAWARIPSMFAAVVGMFMVPIGTIAGAYCIFLLRKSIVSEIFTPRYAQLVHQDELPSYGWLAFVVGILLAISFWLLFILLDGYFMDWKQFIKLFSFF